MYFLIILDEHIVSMFLIFLFSIPVPIISSLISRIIIEKSFGLERYRRLSREIREFDSEFIKAIRKKDEHKIAKLKQRKTYIDQMRKQITKVSFINMFTLFPLFIIIYYILFNFFGGLTPIVYFPLIPEFFFFIIDSHFTFIGWYFLCTFMVSLLINRKLGIYS